MVFFKGNVWDSGTLGKVQFSFEEREDFDGFSPVLQSYGICFNDEGKILIGLCEGANEGAWALPGGTVEPGENPIDTLHREIMEEVDVVADKIFLIGVQKVDFLDIKRDPEYQLRFAVKIKELLPITPDPDNGYLWERKFIDVEEFSNYFPWGAIGEFISKKAKEWFEKNYL